MRVLLIYPVRADFLPIQGILNKMGYQADALSDMGFAVDRVCNSIPGAVLNGHTSSRYERTRGAWRIVDHYALFYHHVLRLCPPEDYDVVYLRYPGASPPLLAFLRSLKARNPHIRVVVEIATYPFAGEAADWKSRLILQSDNVFARFLKRWVDLVVTFCGQSEIYGIPAFATSNGIDVRKIAARAAAPGGAVFRFLGVASVATWHAYDRLLRGLKTHLQTSSSPAHFDIAGDGPALAELRRLTADLGLDSHVTFHGLLTGAALDELFAQAHVGVGSLGMHRIGLGAASSLKNREYCARGLPFVFSGMDADFPEETSPYVFLVPTGDDDVNVAEILRRYGVLVAEHPHFVHDMRQWAEDRLTWRGKLEPVFRHLDALSGLARRDRNAARQA